MTPQLMTTLREAMDFVHRYIEVKWGKVQRVIGVRDGSM